MSILMNVVDNYVTEVAASMLFGLGYYLVKGIKKKNGQHEDKTKSAVKSKLAGALEKWNYVKSIEEYNHLIKDNFGKMDPFEILNIIISKGFTPSIDTYNALLLNCFHNKNFEAAKNLKEELLDVNSPLTPNIFTFNILIKGLGLEYKTLLASGNRSAHIESFDSALQELLNQLHERNILMDVITHNTIIDCLIDQGRLDEAWTHFIYIKTELSPKITCDYYTYTTLLKGIRLKSSNDEIWLERAFSLYNEAKFENRLEESFYNAMLDTCIKFNKVDRAEKFFNEMLIENGLKLKEYSYSIMIKAYSKNYLLDKALEMFNTVKKVLKEESLAPPTEEKSRGVLMLMLPKKEKSPHPTTITYGSIMNACIRCNNFQKAEELSNEMDQLEIKKNSFIFSILINGYRKAHLYERAISLYERLVGSYLSKASYTGDYEKYSVINNDLEQGEDHMGDNVNVVIFNTILDCCVECGRFDKMNEIYTFLSTYAKNSSTTDNRNCINLSDNLPLQPDIITYSIVIKGYAKANQYEKVLDIYNFISAQQDVVIDEVLYNTILDCFAKNGDEQNMLRIFEDMRKKEIQMSVVTYGVIIKLYANLGDIHNANEIFEDLINKGIKPTVIIYQLLLRMYAKKEMPYKAIDVFRNMLLMKVKPDYIIFEYIVNLCLNYGYVKESVEFVILSIEEGIKLDDSVYDYLVDCITSDESVDDSSKYQMMRELNDKLVSKVDYIDPWIVRKIQMFFYNESINGSTYKKEYTRNYQQQRKGYKHINKYDEINAGRNGKITRQPAYQYQYEYEYEHDFVSKQEYYHQKKYTGVEGNTYNKNYYQHCNKPTHKRNKQQQFTEERSIYEL